MGRRAKVSLYRLFTVGGKHRYVPIVRKGRSWRPKTEPTGTPSSYYLRYLKNGKRTFESVGDDLQVALQEQKAVRVSNTPTPITVITQRKTLRTEVQSFLVNRPESWRYILGVFGDWLGWDKDPVSFQREDFQAFAAHLAKLHPANKECLAPRTRKNYLKHVTQFLRSTGRVVIVVRNEQDATIAKATAVIPNTMVLTRADFPKVNKKVKDYYPRSVVDAMFAASKNLRELVMLALFYYTGCREDEVAHLRWTDIRWEAKEFFVREWWKDNWTTKTYEDRSNEIPDQLIEVLKKAYDVLSDPLRYRQEGWLFAGKSPLILPNMFGRPDGHLLKKVQQIAKRAGIACGECRDCVERKGRNCQNFRLHKFRYTYARRLEYEPALADCGKTIDFRATSENGGIVYVDVKTIKPEDTDRWEQFERARAGGWFPENVIVAISEEWGGGEIWHAWFAARARMLEYSLELEQKIRQARLAEKNVDTVLALCSDGFRWRQDQLEDFVAFYSTGAYRADDPFSEMERKYINSNGISLARTISRFAYFERKQGEVRPRCMNWYVRSPRDPFA